MSPESHLHYDSIGQQITMSVPFEKMSMRDKITILHQLMVAFDPGPADESYKVYQVSCGVVLEQANKSWK